MATLCRLTYPIACVRVCGTQLQSKTSFRKWRIYVSRKRQSRHIHKSVKNVESSAAYCVELVRKYDFENYLAALLFPKSSRSSAFAIRALNVEIAQVRDIVSDKNIGQMRMQFWKDAIEAIYKGMPRQTPVSLEMAKAVAKHKLSRHWISRIIESREENLSDAPFRNRQHMEEYCENTVSSVLYLLLETVGVKNVHADHAASHIGKAMGIVTLLRATPFNASKGRVYLPLDVLLENNVPQQSFIRGLSEQPVRDVVYEIASIANRHLNTARSFKKDVPKPALPVFYTTNNVPQQSFIRGLSEQPVRDVVYEIASIANRHLNTARSFKKDVPKPALPVFYTTVSCELYLNAVQAVHFDVFHPSLQQRNHLLPLQLLLRKLKATY